MKRNILAVGVVAILLATAAVAYVLRPSEEASAPIEAVPIAAATETTAPMAEDAVTPEASAENSAPTETTVEDPAPTESTSGEVSFTGTVVYAISQSDSEVRFSIDELLRNQPVTAVGVTDQIAGEIAIDFDTPANSQVGQITVNARTLTTDNSNRNRMIQNQILDTADYEFITFVPTAITGLPDAVQIGEIVSLQLMGDLTIRSVTAPAAFEVTVTIGEDGALSGYAITTVLRSDYDLTIPSVPSVAEVSNEVIVEFEFVALPK